MWKSRHFYEISADERLELNYKLEQAYKKRGKYIQVHTKNNQLIPVRHTACMNLDMLTDEYTFHCGDYWNDETNLLPVIAMTHEMGHYLDVLNNFKLNMMDYHVTLGLLEIEIRAWLYAVDVCKEIGFRHWDAFYKYAEDCLGSYFRDIGWTYFVDKHYGFSGQEPTLENGLQRLKEHIGLELAPSYEIKMENPWDAWCNLGQMKQVDAYMGIPAIKVMDGDSGRVVAEIPYKVPVEESEFDVTSPQYPHNMLMKKKKERKEKLKKFFRAKSWEV